MSSSAVTPIAPGTTPRSRPFACVLGTALLALAVAIGPAARPAEAQNPLKAARQKLEEAKKKAEEIKRRAEEATRKAEEAKAKGGEAAAAAEAARDAVTEGVPAADSARAGAPPAGAGQPAPAPAGARTATAPAPAARGAAPPANLPRSSARVEEKILLADEPAGGTYYISPRGLHVAAIVNRGSRVAVVHDGVDGARYDAIFGAGQSAAPIAFSESGNRFSYVARSGDEFVVVVDGREIARGGPPLQSTGSSTVIEHDFSPRGKHHYFITQKEVSGRRHFQLHLDGRPGPASVDAITPVFSADGERHAYYVTVWNSANTATAQVLIVDGKPAGYLAGEPRFSGDGKALYTKRMLPNGAGEEALRDGQSFLRSPAGGHLQLHVAPVGPLVVGTVWTPFVNSRRQEFLTLGNQKVPGSECAEGGLKVFFSPDARHWAAACPSRSGAWVMADGKKGQDYQSIASDVAFTADGRPVYQATSNNRFFLVVGGEESGPFALQPLTEPDEQGVARPAVIAGNRVAAAAATQMGSGQHTLIVDGKGAPTVYAGDLGFSPDGSRVAYLKGVTGASGSWLVVDGVEHRGLMSMGNLGIQWMRSQGQRARSYVFSPDGKHVAYLAYPASDNTARGVAIDGRYYPLRNVTHGGNLTFTPDGRHLFWLSQVALAPRHVLFVDGEPALEIPADPALFNEAYLRWSMGEDGVLTFLAQTGGQIKRYRVAPGTGSVDAMLARATAVK